MAVGEEESGILRSGWVQAYCLGGESIRVPGSIPD